jgi:hypothetical protein
MIAVLVRFGYESGFSEARVRQVAEAARAKFEGMPELRSKAFTIDPVNREALNFYVWESEEAAKAFFSQQMIDRVTELYGVRPTLQFLDVAVLVENPASWLASDTMNTPNDSEQLGCSVPPPSSLDRVTLWVSRAKCQPTSTVH